MRDRPTGYWIIMASQFRKRRRVPVVASSLVGKKRFKKRTTPLVYPPVFPILDGNVHESPTPSNGAESLESEVPADADMPVDGLDTYNDDDDDQSLTEAGSSAKTLTTAHYRRRAKKQLQHGIILPKISSRQPYR